MLHNAGTYGLFCALLLLNACSGGSKPDPLHSMGNKKILRRSITVLPEWVTRQKNIWSDSNGLIIKVYHEGETILSNARIRTRIRLPELCRGALRDHLRDIWLKAPGTEHITNVGINTAIYLNAVFSTNMDTALSNNISSTTNYWEFWEMETRDETKRAFTVYHLLRGETGLIEALIRKRATVTPFKTGAKTELTNLAVWLLKGPFTHPVPEIKKTIQAMTNSKSNP